MKKLNITKNTVTAVYKELIKADLIEEKWIAVEKANIVCIKNWENKEQEQIHKICEKNKENAIEIITVKEITSLDVIFANEFFNKAELKKSTLFIEKLKKVFYGINIQQMKRIL